MSARFPKKIYLSPKTKKAVLSNITFTEQHSFAVFTEPEDGLVEYIEAKHYRFAVLALQKILAGRIEPEDAGAILRSLGEATE